MEEERYLRFFRMREKNDRFSWFNFFFKQLPPHPKRMVDFVAFLYVSIIELTYRLKDCFG